MSYTKRWLKKLIERDGEFCQYCGGCDDLLVDHVVPISNGGANTISNLKIACRACNSSKKHWTLEEFRLKQSLNVSSFGRIITRPQYERLLALGLVGEIELIKFYYEKVKGE